MMAMRGSASRTGAGLGIYLHFGSQLVHSPLAVPIVGIPMIITGPRIKVRIEVEVEF